MGELGVGQAPGLKRQCRAVKHTLTSPEPSLNHPGISRTSPSGPYTDCTVMETDWKALTECELLSRVVGKHASRVNMFISDECRWNLRLKLVGMIEKPNAFFREERHANISSLCSDFQWLSRLPVTGELDSVTLRQMSQPRCGVSDEGSQQIWAQRVNAIFTGKGAAVRRPRRRRSRRSAAQGIACAFVRHRVCIYVCVCVWEIMCVSKLWYHSLPRVWRIGVVTESQQFTGRVRLCQLKP